MRNDVTPTFLVRFDPDGPGAGAVRLVEALLARTPPEQHVDILFNLLCEAGVALDRIEGVHRAAKRLDMVRALLGGVGSERDYTRWGA